MHGEADRRCKMQMYNNYKIYNCDVLYTSICKDSSDWPVPILTRKRERKKTVLLDKYTPKRTEKTTVTELK
jgi:hypothetical protein